MDFIAKVELVQCYHNDSNQAVEAIYHFRIYEGAAVCAMQAEYADGTVVRGVVQEKKHAQAVYQNAK